MQATFPTILDLLDEGLLIYRRGFTGFVLIAELWAVPIAVGVGLSVAAARYWGIGVTYLIILGWLALAVPLGVYLIGGLSRATTLVQQGHAVHLREALAIPPRRAAGMGCYGVLLYIVANTATSTVSSLCFCVFYIFSVALFAGLGGIFASSEQVGTSLLILMGSLTGLLFVLLYAVSLVLTGAAYSILVYGLQPFLREQLTFGDAVQRSIDMISYRLGRNLLTFVLASAVFGAATVAVTVAIGVLLPLPLWLTLGTDSPVFQGVSTSAWLLGLALALPPMPIWMTLLYQRNLATWQGLDLAEQIATMDKELIERQ